MEGGVWEVRPFRPHVQGGRGGPLRMYGVSLVVSAMGDEGVGGRQLIHLCGVGEVAGDGDLGGVLLAGGGVGDDAVGRPFVVGGVLLRVQLEWGVEWFWRKGAFLGLSRGALLWFRPGIAGSRFPGPLPGWLSLLRPGGGRWCWCLGGGGWLQGEGVVILVCPPNGVSSFGVVVRGLGLGWLAIGWGPDVPS